MQLKSGCRFKLSPDILKEISANKHVLRDISYFRSLPRHIRLITVGDVTTRKLEEAGLKIFLEVVDLKTKRVEDGSFSHREGSLMIRNDAGTISHDLFLLIGKILSGSREARIEVEGEEDLAALPIIYYSDDNTVIAYGVPDTGMASLEVNHGLRTHIIEMLERMEIECQS
ncbi:MAG: DUF359 domain-containing protein [Candidatus Thermoplasmatota archaeon]|jgi:uncharacterized protein (UPF0218 family)|nr:DUF359 domain-containing protein [Candidatus Thermoplasmatota archaeon]